jgi:hypothetical protein
MHGSVTLALSMCVWRVWCVYVAVRRCLIFGLSLRPSLCSAGRWCSAAPSLLLHRLLTNTSTVMAAPQETFLFTSESVNEGHPGTSTHTTLPAGDTPHCASPAPQLMVKSRNGGSARAHIGCSVMLMRVLLFCVLRLLFALLLFCRQDLRSGSLFAHSACLQCIAVVLRSRHAWWPSLSSRCMLTMYASVYALCRCRMPSSMRA